MIVSSNQNPLKNGNYSSYMTIANRLGAVASPILSGYATPKFIADSNIRSQS